MTLKIYILITFTLTIISCGPRSSVSHETENRVCGVTTEDYKPESAKTESQIAGQGLFKTYCGKCHLLDENIKDGNMLRGVCDRVPKGNWFKLFIQNSDSLKNNEDAYSMKIDYEYQSDYEHHFTKLSDKEIVDIYTYLQLW